jgi:adenylate kinase
MLRDEKLAYQDDLEKYMQENDVYMIFETMMKNLIIEQPQDPVPYLLDILQKPQTKRIFIMGPPGSKRKEHILTLADNFEDFKYEAI